jgi:4-hydroxybenzoate polyprenyltransferase
MRSHAADASSVISNGSREPSIPLCVDLDGTMIRGNLLWESVVLLLKHHTVWLFLVPWWLLIGGRPRLKRELAQRSPVDPVDLPYNQELLDFLKRERQGGRQIVLITASDQVLAQQIGTHTAVFHEVHGTSAGNNLKGRKKAEFLCTKFGERGFDYAGDSPSDMPVWRVANAAYVVGTEVTVAQVAAVTEVLGWFPGGTGISGDWWRALRISHWSKNLLMFAPLLLAHRMGWQPLLRILLGIVLFGLCSSGVYVLNDLLDLHSDRAHPWKRSRPFAAGDLSITSGIAASLVLLASAVGLGAVLLSARFAGVLVLYVITTTWYSLHLKRIALLDVFVLSIFYSFRIWAGALVASVPLSQWFMGFILFFFLSLAMAKRYSELVQAAELTDSGNSGRNYRTADRALLMNIGIASCFSAIVILSLYVHSTEVMALYRRPGLLLILCPLVLYWTGRIWLKASRGELNEDPVTLAMKDAVSYYVAAASVAVILLSSW